MMRALLFTISFVLWPMLALAQTATSSAAPGGDATVEALIKAAMSGNWRLAIGMGLMLLVGVAGKLGLLKKIPDEGRRWVAAGLAAAAAVGLGLIGSLDWLTVGIGALTTAFAAVGSWEFIGRRFLGDK